MASLKIALDVLLASLGLWLVMKLMRRGGRLPPGPRGLPVIGNLLDLPSSAQYETYAEWGKKYGGMVYISVFGKSIVVINKFQDAINLFEKKGAVNSGRPVLPMASTLCGWDNTLVLASSGPRVRDMRRIIHNVLGSKVHISKFYATEEAVIHTFLQRVLDAPEKLPQEISRAAGAIILKITYGYDVRGEDDHLVRLVETGAKHGSEAVNPGAWLVDVLPILKHLPAWFPGAGFKQKAAIFRASLLEMVDVPFEQVKEVLATGTPAVSVTAAALQAKENLTADEEDVIKWAAGTMYSGGVETTAATIYAFYLAMILYPGVQRKAQEEIDSVIGRDRLPTFADRENLPYVDAILKEILRWAPVAPLALPHATLEDDQYQGYTIPKDSLMVLNIWNLCHDEDDYQDPFTFNPERFIPTASKSAERDPRDICFGFGRRTCLGRHLADSSVWLTCCLSLAAFNITPSIGADGKEIKPVPRFVEGAVRYPRPFPCEIKARSPELEGLVKVMAGAEFN